LFISFANLEIFDILKYALDSLEQFLL